MSVDTYQRLLVELHEHLARHHVKGWTERVREWITEWTTLSSSQKRDHLSRTKSALSGGMGSLNDILISEENGDAGVDNFEARQLANERLRLLLDQLYEEVSRMLRAEAKAH